MLRHRGLMAAVLMGGARDTTAPTCTITSASSIITAGAFTVTITFSEPVTGFDASDITVGNGSAGAVSGSGPYTSVITPTAAGTVTVDVAAGVCQDAAGNTNTAAVQFSIVATTGAILYIDGSDISQMYQDNTFTTPASADGQTVFVKDKSGNAINLSGGAGVVYKTNIQNGLSVLRGDGTNNYLTTASRSWGIASSTSIWQVAAFIRRDTGAANKTISSFGSYVPAWYMSVVGSDHNQVFWSGAGVFSTTFAQNGAYVAELNRDASRVFTSKVNNVDETGSLTGPDLLIGTKTFNLWAESPTGGNKGQFDLCEYLLFAPAPADNVKAAIRAALSAKWAIFFLADEPFNAPYNPYSVAKANTYKVQTHCHTTESDGADTPTAVMNAYKAAGYDAVAITDHDLLTADPGVNGIIYIPGCEETVAEGHLNCINLTARDESGPGQTVALTVNNQGGFTVITHPDWAGLQWTDGEIAAINYVSHIEIYNAVTLANTEANWDKANSAGKMLLGVAADDCHNIAQVFNAGWVMVHADNTGEIIASLRAGNYYSTQGPAITVAWDGTDLDITTPAAAKIEFISDDGAVVQTNTAATSATYTAAGTETYIRARVTRDSDGKTAWSNPVWL